MTTPPFISEVVKEFVRVYWGSPENPEYKSYISKEIWLTEKLTAVYESGRADGKREGREEGIKEVVGELSRIESNAYPQEPEWGEVQAVVNEAIRALTTEGE